MQLTRIVSGFDFTIRIEVVKPQYSIDGTIYEDFDLTACKNVKVNLVCENHKVVIPLEWRLQDNTNNIILADIIGKQLHTGAVYGVEITGLDDEDKAWRFKNANVFSVVDQTKNAVMNYALIDDPLELQAAIGLYVNAVPMKGEQGDQGERGPQGFQGDKGVDGTVEFEELTPGQIASLRGEQGFQGNQGFQGHLGEQGFQGEQGNQGVMGKRGYQGEMGNQGDKGVDGTVTFDELTPAQKEEIRGPQGFQGNEGVQGPIGLQGNQGEMGNQGHQGEKGEQGEIGVQGHQGEIGMQGVQGEKGEQGEIGVQGEKGEQGFQGNQGEMGNQGHQGEIGVQGEKGEQGFQGNQGEMGNQGFQGNQGVEGYVPSNTILGYQSGIAVSGIKIDVVNTMPSSPDANTLYIVM